MRIRATTLLLATSALTLAVPAWAQDAVAEEEAAGTGIVVTGTRIVRDGYEAPTPVTVATTEELIRSTPTNIPDALNKLPQFQNSFGPARSASNFADIPIHGNVLNLRGLGTTGVNPKGPLRTLVMFDGLRVPATTYIGTVDTNVIPNMLISRVDTVTGGASAAWGSDAVAGVVNFVLDRKFTGIKGQAQYGVSAKGDNDNYRFGLAGGFDFAEDKGHLLLSAPSITAIRACGVTSANWAPAAMPISAAISPAPIPTRPAIPHACAAGGSLNPYSIAANVRINAATEFGKITGSSVGAAFPFLNHLFNADGTIAPLRQRHRDRRWRDPGRRRRLPNSEPRATTIKPFKTYQLFGRMDYEVAPDINFYHPGRLFAAESGLQSAGQLAGRADCGDAVQGQSLSSPPRSTRRCPQAALSMWPNTTPTARAPGCASAPISGWARWASKPSWAAAGRLNVNYTHSESRHADGAVGPL